MGAIEADQMAFQFYRSGVLTSGSGTDYFKIRNSWGASWGDSGYLKVGQNNVCGVLNNPSYPTVGSSPSPVPPSPTPPSPTPPSPTPTPGQCHAISPLATDDWCNTNCAAGFCPADLCQCDGLMV